jgi:hypothetical protein
MEKKGLCGAMAYCPAHTEFVMRLPTKIGGSDDGQHADVSPKKMVESVYSLTEDTIAKVYGKRRMRRQLLSQTERRRRRPFRL